MRSVQCDRIAALVVSFRVGQEVSVAVGNAVFADTLGHHRIKMLHLHVFQRVVEIGVEEQPDLFDLPLFAEIDADRRRFVVGSR